MDSITQAALGGLMGELILRKSIGYKGFLWGVLFGTLPDLDILLNPYLDMAQRLQNHRGLSHSLVAVFLMPWIMGWGLTKIHRQLSYRAAVLFVFLAWSTHVLIDCCNTYGTQILEPFSSQRVGFGNFSIVDPLVTLPMLITLFWVLLGARDPQSKALWVRRCCVWLLCYMAISFGMKQVALMKFQKQLQSQGITYQSLHNAPTLGNIFLWRNIAVTSQGYVISYWSLFDSHQHRGMVSVEKNQYLLDRVESSDELEALKWFSQGRYCVVKLSPSQMLFVDLRLGELFDSEVRQPVFWWVLTHRDGKIQSITCGGLDRSAMKDR